MRRPNSSFSPGDFEAAPRNPSGWPIARSISSLGTRVADWIKTAADYYAAAAAYEQLSGLSDADLERRGLSRASLARDLCASCDRASRPSR